MTTTDTNWQPEGPLIRIENRADQTLASLIFSCAKHVHRAKALSEAGEVNEYGEVRRIVSALLLKADDALRMVIDQRARELEDGE